MESVESYLNDVVLDVSKAVLRHPNLDDFHEDEVELYLFLYTYFQKLATQQQHENSIAVTADDVHKLLNSVLAKNLAGVKAYSAEAQQHPHPPEDLQQHSPRDVKLWWTATHNAPMILQRTLREQMTTQRINLAAFGEVVEMCRYLDDLQQREQSTGAKPPSAVAAPFGTVNLIHFIAVYMTLMPTKNLFELLSTLFSGSVSDLIKVKILHCWALIDRTNRAALNDVVDLVISHRNLTLPLLVELHPEVKKIATEEATAAAASRPQSSVGPAIVSHGVDDGVDLLAVLGDMPPPGAAPAPGGGAVLHYTTDEPAASGGQEPTVVQYHAEDGGVAADEDAEEEVPRSAEDQAFWNQLVS